MITVKLMLLTQQTLLHTNPSHQDEPFQSEMVDDRKPVVPFMAIKEHIKQVNTEDTIKVVKESIQDSIYENSKTMMRLLDKIGDRLTNVVEDFQKKQS